MTQKALCIGINRFKHVPSATLRGCVNDAHDMAALLKERHGFGEADIALLTDAQATKVAILRALQGMVDAARAGSLKRLVFSFSSHGTQVPDQDGDEDDRSDEAFCPYDLKPMGGAWDPNFIITDDELNALFKPLPEDVTLEVFLDTCHSGTGLRRLDPLTLLIPNAPKPRYLPPPSLAMARALAMTHPRNLSTRRRDIVPLSKRHVLWTGCRSDQTSADAMFDSRANGAFTYHYIRTVRASNGALSRAQVRDRVRAALRRAGYDQVPQLETNALRRKERATGMG